MIFGCKNFLLWGLLEATCKHETRAVFLEEKHQVWGWSLHSCSCWCSPGSGALRALLFSLQIRILQMKVKLAFLEAVQCSSWIFFQKQAEAVSGSREVTEELILDRWTLQVIPWFEEWFPCPVTLQRHHVNMKETGQTSRENSQMNYP